VSREEDTSEHQTAEQAIAGQLEGVQATYNRWASIYDWNPVLALVRPARQRAVEAMDLGAGDTVVDMGTGTGANLPLLRDAVGETGSVIGIDASPKMLQRARIRIANQGWENVSVLQGDIRDPPIEGPVDGICSAFVAVMYDDPRTLLEPWADLVESGAIATLYSGPSQGGYAPAVNAFLRGYLRVFEAGWDVEGDRTPIEVLTHRGERVRTTLTALADSTTHEEFAIGLVKLDVGRFYQG
jgi:SAM-dependent methyltransferase